MEDRSLCPLQNRAAGAELDTPKRHADSWLYICQRCRPREVPL